MERMLTPPTPTQVFDIVHARVRELQATQGSITAVRECVSEARAPIANGVDYLADFELAGRRTLEVRWPKRWYLFHRYFVNGAPPKQVMRELGIPRGTFDWWCMQIKIAVGRELPRAGLFPPRRYGQRRIECVKG